MAYLGIDLGGTKVCFGLFTDSGKVLFREVVTLDKKKGNEVGQLITTGITRVIQSSANKIRSIGISVPGIYHIKSGTVWAPNIPGWENYPLLQEIKNSFPQVPVTIDSDRACYILGEFWKGNAQGCLDVIYLAVGTGIGAGILVNGQVLRGANDIAGAIGWMALSKPFKEEYIDCGCFETYASGEGIAKLATKYIQDDNTYEGLLKNVKIISAKQIFDAFEKQDPLAKRVILDCIESWGMAAANLVSLFNPERIIFGGGVFGPAIKFIPQIKEEAMRWAQPISIRQVDFESSSLGNDAGVFGAAFLALNNKHTTLSK